MKAPLYIRGYGAVTAAGLDARQTLASIRSSLSAVQEEVLTNPLGAVQTVARIPTYWRLRESPEEWFANLAARALGDTLPKVPDPSDDQTVLLVTMPEAFRDHPALRNRNSSVLRMIESKTGRKFHPASSLIDGGAAATIASIERADEMLGLSHVGQVVIGGVDSLIDPEELSRIGKERRLKGAENPQGLVPGEGAVFLSLTRQPPGPDGIPAAILGTGIASEANTAASENFSQGHAILAALQTAVSSKSAREPDIDFIVSNGNGERYTAWEQMIARPRFYRTRRDSLPIAYPAMTVGDIGAASGALALMVAADSFARGYAPGGTAVCEVASEGALRGAAILRRAG